MIQTSHDPAADAFYVRFAPEVVVIESTQEVAAGVILDLDAGGRLVGIEVLGVQARHHTAAVKLATAPPPVA